MTEKFLFTVKSFLNMKAILEIVEQKDLFMGNQLILMMEFDGEVLKVTVRYYNPKTKVIYNFKTYKPDQESKKVTYYDHSDYSGDSDDESHSRWTVECQFTKIQEFFSDELTRNILDVVREELSDEDCNDEKDPQIGSVYLSYSESNEESQSVLAPRERKGSLVITISNTKPSDTKDTMRHKVRISVKVRDLTSVTSVTSD